MLNSLENKSQPLDNKRSQTMKKYFCLCIIFVGFLTVMVAEDLPNGYREIRLGMSLEQVKENLQEDAIFNYRGERDVSLLTGKNQTIIETSSESWLENCWFQFYNDELYSIIINFNPEYFDYNTIYNTLTDSYGIHSEMDPKRVVWETAAITMSLEKPISVKYLDNYIFEDIRDLSMIKETKMEETRQSLLEDL